MIDWLLTVRYSPLALILLVVGVFLVVEGLPAAYKWLRRRWPSA